VADLHANLAALEAVLVHAGSVDEVWCLGDFVGYGPNPNEVLARLDGYSLRALAGNHDWGAIGKADLRDFNPDARRACEWTASVLDSDTRAYLQGLDTAGVMRDVYVAHGSPRDPVWEYLTNLRLAQVNFGYFSNDVCLVGHTHVPVVFRWRTGKSGAAAFATEVPQADGEIVVGNDRLIFNPGSVGQPRDGDARAAYALFDPEARVFRFRRAPYEVAQTQTAMRAVGLPDRLAIRLQYGW